MIICSCNIISTDDIRECIERIPSPTPKKVIKALGWEANCGSCAHNLVDTIRDIISDSEI